MSVHPLRSAPAPVPAIPVTRRGALATLAAIVRNPMEATPPECFAQPIVSAPLFGRQRLYISDPALIHEAYVKGAEHLSKGDVVRRVLEPAFGTGLLSAEGAHWRHQRRAAAPAFAHDKLVACLPAMIAAAEATRDVWRARDGVIDVNHAMTMTTFAIVVETILSGAAGGDALRYERELGAYLGATSWLAAVALAGLPPGTPFPGRRRAMAAARWLRATVGAMVASRRRERTAAARADLVSLLLDAVDPDTGRGLDDAEVTDNLLTFIAAGHETTAQGLAWTLRLLADAPAIEAALVDEVEAVTGGAKLRPEHVVRLDVARRVFSEAMRLYPPAPLIERHVESDMALGGHAVAAGTTLVVPIHALHRHPGLWDAPERFDPARFTPEGMRGRHRFAYMPFGAGPRICIGGGFAMMEAVAILAVLLRDLRLGAVDPDLPAPRMRLTLRPARPILMRAERRPRRRVA